MESALDLLQEDEGADMRPAPAASMLDKMFEHKVVTISYLECFSSVSKVVSRSALDAAEKKKIGMPRELYNLIGDR